MSSDGKTEIPKVHTTEYLCLSEIVDYIRTFDDYKASKVHSEMLEFYGDNSTMVAILFGSVYYKYPEIEYLTKLVHNLYPQFRENYGFNLWLD